MLLWKAYVFSVCLKNLKLKVGLLRCQVILEIAITVLRRKLVCLPVWFKDLELNRGFLCFQVWKLNFGFPIGSRSALSCHCGATRSTLVHAGVVWGRLLADSAWASAALSCLWVDFGLTSGYFEYVL